MSSIDIFAWIDLVVLTAMLVAIIVALGMMPSHIARKRGHPWAQAVTVGSWATLIFGFVFWPLVLIWAHLDFPAKREVKVDDQDVARHLPAGSAGLAAIYTDHVKAAHVIRQVMLRQSAILNYVNPF